jgi:hypothetical protein
MIGDISYVAHVKRPALGVKHRSVLGAPLRAQ